MAEAMLRRRLDERGIDVAVSSSGLTPPGRPAPAEVVERMAQRGLDLSAHRSRTVDADIIAEADLVIGMERRHLTELIGITPEAYTRFFTLPELVRRIEDLAVDPDRPASAPADLEAVLAAIAETRGRRELLRITVAEEVPDPMGRAPKVYDRVVDELTDLIDRLVEALWPTPRSAAPVGAEAE